MDALLEGELIIGVGGCPRVKAPGGESYLIVWPTNVQLETADSSYRIVDELTGVAMRLGDEVSLSGGEVPDPSSLTEGLITPIPAGCPGPVWIAGELIR